MKHSEMIKKAVQIQSEDEGLWADAEGIAEAYIQDSLRDLHRVIEDADEEAYLRIKARAEGEEE